MIFKTITSEGIYYENNFGENLFLNYKECNNNWLLYRKRTEFLNDEQIFELKGKDKTIGQRDVDPQKCYIEFFTQPFTRFEFKNPEQMSDYLRLRDSIQFNGWTTHDLS